MYPWSRRQVPRRGLLVAQAPMCGRETHRQYSYSLSFLFPFLWSSPPPSLFLSSCLSIFLSVYCLSVHGTLFHAVGRFEGDQAQLNSASPYNKRDRYVNGILVYNSGFFTIEARKKGGDRGQARGGGEREGDLRA